MSEPRNVTPGAAQPGPTQPGSTAYSAERSERGEWQGWSGSTRGRSFPWLGVLLVLIGLALLIQYLYPTVSVGTLVLLALGLAFVAAWVFGRSWFSLVPGVLLVALGVAELIEDMALLGPAGEDVPGLASSALALGFLTLWLVGIVARRRWTWPLWGAGLFGLIGIAQLSGRLVGIPEVGFLWPVVIIVIGIVLLVASRRRERAT